MKHNYFKGLMLLALITFLTTDLMAQTFVTIWKEDFEDKTDGINVKQIGFGVNTGNAFVKILTSDGANGSNGYAEGNTAQNNQNINWTFFPLPVDAIYQYSVYARFPSGQNHKPIILRQATATGELVSGSSYYDVAAIPGTGDWVQYTSPEVTILSGAEGIQVQSYRFPKQELEIDDLVLKIKGGIAWTGATSTDWYTASNWDGGVVPTSADHVLIPAGAANMPEVNGADVELTSLEVAAGASLMVSGTTTLTVSGQLTGEGTGYVEVMSGASIIASRISGSNHIIHRQTRFSNGQYSVVGSPVVFGQLASLGTLVYSYDETVAYNSSIDNPGTGNDGLDRFVEMTTPTDMLTSGAGYFSAYTDQMTFTGILNYRDVATPITYTDHDAGGTLDENNHEGFNLVSNPYPSAIDFNQLIGVNGSSAGSGIIEDAIWIWDDHGSHTGRGSNADYVTINAMGAVGTESNTASGLWDGYIRSGQGFFVKATAAGDLSFTPAMQTADNNSDAGFYRTANDAYETFKIVIRDIDKTVKNESMIGLSADASFGIDHLDAQKVSTTGLLKIYTMSEGKPLAIQSLPSNFMEASVPIGFFAAAEGSYEIAVSDFKSWGSNEIVLIDNQTGQSVNLSREGSYTFHSIEGMDKSRFELKISSTVLSTNLANEMIIDLMKNGVSVKIDGSGTSETQISISDISGRLLAHNRFSSNQFFLQYPLQNDKIYIIRLERDGQVNTKKFVIK